MLAVLLELGLVLVHLLGAWRAVLVAEEAEQRAGQILGEIDGRHRRFRVEVLFRHHDAAAPQLDAGVHVLLLAGVEEGMTAARAGAEDADLAVVALLRAHPFDGAFGVADDLRVGHAPFGADLGADVVGIAEARALIQVGADGEVAVVRELARHLDVELAPAGEMMHEHDAGERAISGGAGGVGGDIGAPVALDLDLLARDAAVSRHFFFSLERWLRPAAAWVPSWWSRG